MRILIHDYPGHPFQVQLSRELARRGHRVLHVYAGYNVTPRGELVRNNSDPKTFQVDPIYIRKPLKKYSYFKRWVQEREYGRLLVKKIQEFKPHTIISANTPLDAQGLAQKYAHKEEINFVFWLQDIIGIATKKLLCKKLSFFGSLIGIYYIQQERKLLRKSNHIITISKDFQPLLGHWGIHSEKISVIPNWAPLNSMPVYSKRNPWAQQYHLVDKFCFMYTGSLGMKHNPDVLLQLALRYQGRDDVSVVVISEGPGADWLKKKKAEFEVDNLELLPYQPFEQLPQVMASADTLVALLDSDAGVFSVPSKVLTYLCAQRPLLLSVPLDNLAAKIVSQHHAGYVVPPNDIKAFLRGSEQMLINPSLCEQFAYNGRKYAEKHFKIQKKGNQFENILANIT